MNEEHDNTGAPERLGSKPSNFQFFRVNLRKKTKNDIIRRSNVISVAHKISFPARNA